MLALPHGGPFKLTYEGELHLGRWYHYHVWYAQLPGYGYVCILGTHYKGRS